MAAFGFFLKKLITAFIMPLSLVLSLFLLSLILLFRKKEKLGLILASIALTLIFCFTTPWLVHLLLSPLEDSYRTFKSEKNISAIVVLGHGHGSNKDIPTHAQLSSSALFRLSEAWRIHKKSPSTKIILSGAAITDPIAHAEVLAATAKEFGIDETKIQLMTKTYDTHDEAVEITKVLGKKEEFALVTSASHMPRAMALFRAAGAKPIAAPGEFLLKRKKLNSWRYYIPQAAYLRLLETAWHEYLGIFWSYLKGQLKRKDLLSSNSLR